MKRRLFTASIAVAASISLSAQQFSFDKKNVNSDTNEVSIDYKDIKKGSDGKRVFMFTNTGDKPLIISKVETSCGCTTPEYSKVPVLPGKEGKIVVKYDTHRIGAFQKSITVYSNAVDNERKVLKIRGNVLGE